MLPVNCLLIQINLVQLVTYNLSISGNYSLHLVKNKSWSLTVVSIPHPLCFHCVGSARPCFLTSNGGSRAQFDSEVDWLGIVLIMLYVLIKRCNFIGRGLSVGNFQLQKCSSIIAGSGGSWDFSASLVTFNRLFPLTCGYFSKRLQFLMV